jgi:hypothetical protein
MVPKNMNIEVLEGQEFGVFWGKSFFTQVIDKAPIIEDLLYTNDVISISADAGVGKSLLALQLSCNLTTGTPFLNTYKVTHPCNVCYLQTEGDRGETVERVKAMASGIGFDPNKFALINLSGICLNTPEGMEQLKELMLAPKMKFDVLIIDPLYTTVKGSMSKDEVATDWIRNMREIKGLFKNCAMIILHHLPKDNYVDGVKMPKTMFGSAMWKAYMNYSYNLSKHEAHHVLALEKRRNDKIGFEQLELKLLEPFPLRFVYLEDDPSLAKTKVRETLKQSHEPMSAKKIIDITKLSKASVFRVLKLLMKEETVAKITDHDRVIAYRYKEENEH